MTAPPEPALQARIKELEAELDRLIKDPVSWREETFRMRLAESERRVEELEDALAVVPVLTAKLLEVEKERDALRGLIQ